MALKLRLQQKPTSSLVMTPQLQQAIRLLQLPHQELGSLLRQELQENPLLEEREDDPAAADLWPAGELAGRDATQAGERAARHVPTLQDHLRWQAPMLRLEGREMRAALTLIDYLDEDGLLPPEALAQAAAEAGGDQRLVEQVLQRLQELDPPGVAACSLAECLAIQARRLAHPHPLLLQIVEGHLELVARGSMDRLARTLGAPRAEAVAAIQQLRCLHPRPGRLFGGVPTTFVVPDIFVRRHHDDWLVLLNGEGLPRLALHQHYRQVDAADPQTRAYIQERARAAQSLLRGVAMRQRTIYRVMRSILAFQRGFFEHGVGALKPLVLRQVADDVGMHESTISRVTSNKFVQVAQGTFELKFFFNPSIGCLDGQSIASKSVRSQIARLVAGEDGRRPYSDQQLVQMLKGSDIDIARRTVAKYREMLKILPSSRRRHLF